MYKIIGGDQKEYGPVSADDLRRWITEGRANARTQVLAEGTTEWKPLSAVPEFADLFSTAFPPLPASSAGATGWVTPEDLLLRDYALDIGHCLTRSWELVRKNLWPVAGITFLVMAIVIGINQLLGLISGPAMRDMIEHSRFSPGAILLVCGVSILSTPVYTILVGGLFKYYLKLIRGEAAGIGDAFSGFGPAIAQLALLGLVSSLLSFLGYCLCILPGLYLNVAWMFGIPLVMDRNMGFWEALELSRKVVSKHWFLMFGFMLVVGLVAACGVLACCIGMLVTAPIGWVAMLYAYEDIFGRPTA
ncbi:MAG: GYF domain-containing protein [Verrucomicrobia bacterium]|nr:GYF domain-containing protein [Verrucomicrobiota bacterium]